MSIENPTLAHFRHFSSLFTLSLLYICRESSTNQLLFMQNKPNVNDAQINVISYMKGNYEKLDTWLSGKNKPNSNPNKPNFKKAKMDVNLYFIEDYRKKDDFLVRINKPNFRNGQNERNCLYHKGLQKKRLFSSPKNKPNSNPIFSKAKMNANVFITNDYENDTALRPQKNRFIRLMRRWTKQNRALELFGEKNRLGRGSNLGQAGGNLCLWGPERFFSIVRNAQYTYPLFGRAKKTNPIQTLS